MQEAGLRIILPYSLRNTRGVCILLQHTESLADPFGRKATLVRLLYMARNFCLLLCVLELKLQIHQLSFCGLDLLVQGGNLCVVHRSSTT